LRVSRFFSISYHAPGASRPTNDYFLSKIHCIHKVTAKFPKPAFNSLQQCKARLDNQRESDYIFQNNFTEILIESAAESADFFLLTIADAKYATDSDSGEENY